MAEIRPKDDSWRKTARLTKVKNRKHRPWRIGDATTKDHSGRNAPAVVR
jgi:hypothetical protein